MATDRIDELTEQVIGCAITVHRELGPGLLESIYRDCLCIELTESGLHAESNRRVPVKYRGRFVRDDLKIDLLVEGCLIIEVKAVDSLQPIHKAQVITYLKLSGHPAGLLLNFNGITLRSGIRRLDHPARYAAKHGPDRKADGQTTPGEQ